MSLWSAKINQEKISPSLVINPDFWQPYQKCRQILILAPWVQIMWRHGKEDFFLKVMSFDNKSMLFTFFDFCANEPVYFKLKIYNVFFPALIIYLSVSADSSSFFLRIPFCYILSEKMASNLLPIPRNFFLPPLNGPSQGRGKKIHGLCFPGI